MNLVTHVPYRADANLGRAYNDFMGYLGAHDWAAFLDHDAMPTTGLWHRQIAEAIAFKPGAGAFVAMTNRIASKWQRAGPELSNDVAVHRVYGAERAKVRSMLDITDTKGFGGVLFAVSKAAWQDCGGFADGLGCVDHSLHFRLRARGRRIYLIEGLYVYHWRHFGEPDPTSLHPKAKDCPCRGPELWPDRREWL
jgi:GT2 family glycosyltransferase